MNWLVDILFNWARKNVCSIRYNIMSLGKLMATRLFVHECISLERVAITADDYVLHQFHY